MSTAVLLSGGLDSAVLLAEEAQRHEVQPLYVSVGLAWEDDERRAAGLDGLANVVMKTERSRAMAR